MKVLVTKCTRNTGLTSIRALSRAGCEVYGVDDRRLPMGLKSHHATGPYHLLPPAEDPALATSLTELLDRLRPDVIIPFRDAEFFCRHQHSILQRTHALFPEMASFNLLQDKGKLLQLSRRIGIPTPIVLEPQHSIQFLRGDRSCPVVIKPRRDIGGGAGVYFVSDPAQVMDTHRRVEKLYGDAIITEYIPGPTSNIRAIHLLFDPDSRLLAHFVLQKLRIWPRNVGGSVAAVSTHEPWLVDQILPIFRALRWRGPADAELKIDARDGSAKLLEINPRFSGVVHFPIQCGVNFPLLYCRAACGERLKEESEPHYAAGRRYISAQRWFKAAAADLCDSGAGRFIQLTRNWRAEWLESRVRSVNEILDPAPTLGRLLLALKSRRNKARENRQP